MNRSKTDELKAENKALKEKLDIAVKALEFYALKRHKILIKNCEIVKVPETKFSNYQGYIDGILTIENGDEAKEALAQIKGEKK